MTLLRQSCLCGSVTGELVYEMDPIPLLLVILGLASGIQTEPIDEGSGYANTRSWSDNNPQPQSYSIYNSHHEPRSEATQDHTAFSAPQDSTKQTTYLPQTYNNPILRDVFMDRSPSTFSRHDIIKDSSQSPLVLSNPIDANIHTDSSFPLSKAGNNIAMKQIAIDAIRQVQTNGKLFTPKQNNYDNFNSQSQIKGNLFNQREKDVLHSGEIKLKNPLNFPNLPVQDGTPTLTSVSQSQTADALMNYNDHTQFSDFLVKREYPTNLMNTPIGTSSKLMVQNREVLLNPGGVQFPRNSDTTSTQKSHVQVDPNTFSKSLGNVVSQSDLIQQLLRSSRFQSKNLGGSSQLQKQAMEYPNKQPGTEHYSFDVTNKEPFESTNSAHLDLMSFKPQLESLTKDSLLRQQKKEIVNQQGEHTPTHMNLFLQNDGKFYSQEFEQLSDNSRIPAQNERVNYNQHQKQSPISLGLLNHQIDSKTLFPKLKEIIANSMSQLKHSQVSNVPHFNKMAPFQHEQVNIQLANSQDKQISDLHSELNTRLTLKPEVKETTRKLILNPKIRRDQFDNDWINKVKESLEKFKNAKITPIAKVDYNDNNPLPTLESIESSSQSASKAVDSKLVENKDVYSSVLTPIQENKPRISVSQAVSESDLNSHLPVHVSVSPKEKLSSDTLKTSGKTRLVSNVEKIKTSVSSDLSKISSRLEPESNNGTLTSIPHLSNQSEQVATKHDVPSNLSTHAAPQEKPQDQSLITSCETTCKGCNATGKVNDGVCRCFASDGWQVMCPVPLTNGSQGSAPQPTTEEGEGSVKLVREERCLLGAARPKPAPTTYNLQATLAKGLEDFNAAERAAEFRKRVEALQSRAAAGWKAGRSDPGRGLVKPLSVPVSPYPAGPVTPAKLVAPPKLVLPTAATKTVTVNNRLQIPTIKRSVVPTQRTTLLTNVLEDLQGRINKPQLNNRLVNGRLLGFPNTILQSPLLVRSPIGVTPASNYTPQQPVQRVALPVVQSSHAGLQDPMFIDFPDREAMVSLSDSVARVSSGDLSAVGGIVESARGVGSGVGHMVEGMIVNSQKVL